VGMDSPRVTVETHLPGGLPGFTLVGLPETAVREARDRVKSAIQNCGLDYPRGKVVVNLAPAELTKEGARFDLAIAVSILRATGQLPRSQAGDLEFVGELGLYGELRATRGCLCAVVALGREDPHGRARLIVPAGNGRECRAVPTGRLLIARHLSELVAFLRDPQASPLPGPEDAAAEHGGEPDPCASLEDVVGQLAAKRALAIAAAGEHHLLLSGPPGTGKTLLARRLAGLLPDLQRQQAMEVAAVYSAAGLPGPPPGRPPIREPHHSASAPALVGGGRDAVPGEISLAHQGVLLLDEMPLFKPSVLDLLREPLESRRIIVARARYRASFPAAFQLVGTMNPCPAGQVCSDTTCRCSPDQVRRYRSRVSGPLLDRIDLHVTVPPLEGSFAAALDATETTSTAEVRAQVAAARERRRQRQGCSNGTLPASRLKAVTAMEAGAQRLLERAGEGFALSMRGLHRVLRVARSIADLEGSSGVTASQLAEALSYRDSPTM
jgi:magnesium chelatase family protein